MKILIMIFFVISSFEALANPIREGGDADSRIEIANAKAEAEHKRLAAEQQRRQDEITRNTFNKKREIEAIAIELLANEGHLKAQDGDGSGATLSKFNYLSEQIMNISSGDVDQNQIMQFKIIISKKIQEKAYLQYQEDLEKRDDQLFKKI